jgi:hypothetical protein
MKNSGFMKRVFLLPVLTLSSQLAIAAPSIEEQVFQMIKSCAEERQQSYLSALLFEMKLMQTIDSNQSHFEQQKQMKHHHRVIKTLGDEVYNECVLPKQQQST